METYFVDFEASSLESGSYPIEIGWVNTKGHGESYLIRPQPNWQGWSAKAEAIHKISYATLLRDGKPAEFVARRALAVLSDAHYLISDNPEFEDYWMTVLLTVIGAKPLKFDQFSSMIGYEISRMLTLDQTPPNTADALWKEGEKIATAASQGAQMALQTRHRALADAERLWRIWKATRAGIDRRLRMSRSIGV
jgi:hypothetical protein